jgi:hypothetical protein
MRRTAWFLLILVTGLIAWAGGVSPLLAQPDDVIVVPRYPGSLPTVELKRPELPERVKTPALPPSNRTRPDTRTRADTVRARTVKPTLLSKLSVDTGTARSVQQQEQDQLASEGYFFITGQIKGVGWAKLYLYDHRGGFFDPYNRDQELNLLGTTFMDSKGRFRIGPIQFKNRWYYQGKDIVLVMELDSPYAVAYSDLYGTVQPFRFKVAERKRVTPEGGEYSMGTVELNLDREQFYPVRVFDRVVRRLQREGRSTDQKVRVEFVRDVDEPRYMEDIGYILMPYSGQAE